MKTQTKPSDQKRVKSYDSVWLKHKPAGMDDHEFLDHVRASTPVLAALKNMIQDQIEARERVAETDYDTPSWSHKQAHRNGFIACAEKISKLLPDPKER